MTMDLLEGVGNEVTLFFGFLLLLLIMSLAWWSTNVSDLPVFRALVVLEQRGSQRTASEQPSPSPDMVDSNQASGVSVPELEREEESAEKRNDSSAMQQSGTCEGQAQRDENHVLGNPEDVSISEPESRNSTITCDAGQQLSSLAYSTEGKQDVPNDSASQDVTVEATVKQEELGSEIPTGNVLSSSSASSEVNVLRQRRVASDTSRIVHDTSLKSSVHCTCTTQADGIVADQNHSDGETANSDSLDHPDKNIVKHDSSATGPDSDEVIPGNIRIRLKFLDDTQKLVLGKLEEQLGDFKRRHFSLEITTNKLVKLIFNGQMLMSDSETLQHYGLFDNCVVHCLVHHHRSRVEQPAAARTEEFQDLDMSHFLFPLFGIILGIIWYCRFQYGQYFSATSTVALIGLTGLFVFSLFAIYIPTRHQGVQP